MTFQIRSWLATISDMRRASEYMTTATIARAMPTS